MPIFESRMPHRLTFDPDQAVAHLRSSDPVLKEAIDRFGPFKLEWGRSRNLFEALLRSIVYQQLNGKAASTILGRVVAVLKRRGGLTPTAVAAAPDEELRSAGLSRGKLASLRDLAQKCAEGIVPTLAQARRMGDEELVERLTQVRGVGPWTVHMLLIFTLRRPDVMPVGDFAIRQGFRRLYGMRSEPKPSTILRRSRCWQPYRSVASWYLWRVVD